MRLSATRFCLVLALSVFPFVFLRAADSPFRDGPASAIDAGKTVYARNCLSCHGKALKGTGNVPSLVDGKLKGVTSGEIFWFITKGSPNDGMPPWGFLPEQKRWQ